MRVGCDGCDMFAVVLRLAAPDVFLSLLLRICRKRIVMESSAVGGVMDGGRCELAGADELSSQSPLRRLIWGGSRESCSVGCAWKMKREFKWEWANARFVVLVKKLRCGSTTCTTRDACLFGFGWLANRRPAALRALE